MKLKQNSLKQFQNSFKTVSFQFRFVARGHSITPLLCTTSRASAAGVIWQLSRVSLQQSDAWYVRSARSQPSVRAGIPGRDGAPQVSSVYRGGKKPHSWGSLQHGFHINWGSVLFFASTKMGSGVFCSVWFYMGLVFTLRITWQFQLITQTVLENRNSPWQWTWNKTRQKLQNIAAMRVKIETVRYYY